MINFTDAVYCTSICIPGECRPLTREPLVDPPPCNCDIMGIQEGPNTTTTVPYSYYYCVGDPPNIPPKASTRSEPEALHSMLSPGPFLSLSFPFLIHYGHLLDPKCRLNHDPNHLFKKRQLGHHFTYFRG